MARSFPFFAFPSSWLRYLHSVLAVTLPFIPIGLLHCRFGPDENQWGERRQPRPFVSCARLHTNPASGAASFVLSLRVPSSLHHRLSLLFLLLCLCLMPIRTHSHPPTAPNKHTRFVSILLVNCPTTQPSDHRPRLGHGQAGHAPSVRPHPSETQTGTDRHRQAFSRHAPTPIL